MDISEFVSTLRYELELCAPDVMTYVGQMGADPASALSACEQYANLLERFGGAAGVIGMQGVVQYIEQLNAALLPVAGNAAGGQVPSENDQKFLMEWPLHMLAYLEDSSSFEHAQRMVEHLALNPAGAPDADAQLQLMQALLEPPQIPEELLAHAQEQYDIPTEATAEDVTLQLSDDIDQQLYTAFMNDAPDQTARLIELLDAVGHGQTGETLIEAKRIAHTFKGTANIVGIRGVASIAHRAEDLLEFVEKNPGVAPPQMFSALSDAAACMDQQIYALSGQEEAPVQAQAVLQRLLDWARAAINGDIQSGDIPPHLLQAPAPTKRAVATPTQEPSAQNTPQAAGAEKWSGETIRVPVETLERLFRLVGQTSVQLAQLQEELKQTYHRTGALQEHNINLQQRVIGLDTLVDKHGLAVSLKADTEDVQFDALEMDRFGELHGASRSVAESVADANAMTTTVRGELDKLSTTLQRQMQTQRELRDIITSTRMVPVKNILSRLQRNVRQTAQATGKQADLVIEGADLQLDSDVLNRLAEPLLHLLRNAVDHGIEMPDERMQEGKPAQGTITLQFERRAQNIMITCSDDGKGLDYARIMAKAMELDLINPEIMPTEQDLARLIMLPGFSTREKVTEVSGRGVGMDVVAERIAALKGSVDISSTPGVGTIFMLRVPASLVSAHVLIVRVQEELYGIPSDQVSIALAAGMGRTFHENNVPKYDFEGSIANLVSLAKLVNLPVEGDEFAQENPVVLISQGLSTVAVSVDQIVDSREMVLKETGRFVGKLRGVTGATLTAAGKVLPIVDVNELARAQTLAKPSLSRQRMAMRAKATSVLVVDDSLSVRNSLVQLLSDSGYDVRSARDGFEALELIKKSAPQVVLTDLEMPNMNGLELTRNIRADEQIARLPVVMITSRTMQKHRDEAANAGVTVYLTKPYSESNLLEHVNALTTANKQAA